MAEADPGLFGPLASVPEAAAADAEALDLRLSEARTPFLVRGLAAGWPLVHAGRVSAAAARAYLVEHARERPFTVNIGAPGGGERLFYDSAMQVNFRMAQGALADILAGIDANEGMPDAPLIYLSSVNVPAYFDGLEDANPMPLGDREPIVGIWIGTRTRIAAHNDFPNNLACCAVGRRRFILFPPEQFANL
ncbi:MAG: cupin, partial [Alphaproteobacteria bacterium]|nr:cupin [Alphaproteobacteria bacterium]